MTIDTKSIKALISSMSGTVDAEALAKASDSARVSMVVALTQSIDTDHQEGLYHVALGKAELRARVAKATQKQRLEAKLDEKLEMASLVEALPLDQQITLGKKPEKVEEVPASKGKGKTVTVEAAAIPQ